MFSDGFEVKNIVDVRNSILVSLTYDSPQWRIGRETQLITFTKIENLKHI